MAGRAAILPDAELDRLRRIAHELIAAPGEHGGGMKPGGRAAASGLEFRDFTEYSPGADLRRVDWRYSASRSRPRVRTYDDEASADWFICLDRSASMGVISAKWRLATELSAAMAFLLLCAGHRVALVQFSSAVDHLCPLGRGHRHYAHLVDALTGGAPDSGGGASELASAGPLVTAGAHVLIVSDFLAPDGMWGALSSLQRPGRRIDALKVLAATETALPAAGAVRIQDVESGQTLSVSPAAGHVATQALDRQAAALQAFCVGRNIRLTACHSDAHWRAVVLRHLRGAGA